MGNGEAAPLAKSDKSSSQVQVQTIIHPYPDWEAVQVSYGPGFSMPPPYFAAVVASDHARPPYIWGHQGSNLQGRVIVSPPSTNEAVVVASPLSMEPSVKTSDDSGRSLLKKLKGIHGLPVSNNDGKKENTSGHAVHGQSKSEKYSAEGSSNGTDDEQAGRKRQRGSSEDYANSGKDGKAVRPDSAVYARETDQPSNMPSDFPIAPANITRKIVVTATSSSPSPGIECRVSVIGKIKASTAPASTTTDAVVPGCDGVPIELSIQDERVLKRERRKQSNRESARRSRLRKQAETEELAMKVETLGAENTTLRTEIILLKEKSEKLRLENSALLEVLKNAQLNQAEEKSEKEQPQGLPVVCTGNLSRVHNSNSCSSSGKQEADQPVNSSGKVHLLLGPSSRNDVVAAR